MRLGRISIVILLLCLSLPAWSLADLMGPYSGQVLDAQTGEPIQGASVLIYWVKCLPGFEGCNSVAAKTAYLTSDAGGEYKLGKTFVDTGLAGSLETSYIMIYQPGYMLYEARHEYIWPWDSPRPTFPHKDNIVRLRRVPADFDHREHFDEINRLLSYYLAPRHQPGQADAGNLFSDPAQLLERAVWEDDVRAKRSWKQSSRTAKIKDSELNALIKGLSDVNPAVRREKIRVLAGYQDKRAIEPLIARLNDPDIWVRLVAARALGSIGDCLEPIIPLMNLVAVEDVWPHSLLQREALRAIRKLYESRTYVVRRKDAGEEKFALDMKVTKSLLDPRQVSKFKALLLQKLSDPFLKAESIQLFGLLGDQTHLSRLRAELADPHEEIRALALTVMSSILFDGPGNETQTADIKTTEQIGALVDDAIGALRDPAPQVRKIAADILGKAKREKALKPLLDALSETNLEAKIAIIKALGQYHDDSMVEPLLEASAKGNDEMRKEALKVLSLYSDIRIVKALPAHFESFRFREDNDVLIRTFHQVARATHQGLRLTYKYNGKRYVEEIAVGKPVTIPYESSGVELKILNPVAVDSLLAVIPTSSDGLTTQEDKRRAEAATLLLKFEDPRIRSLADALYRDPSPVVREAALRLIYDTNEEPVAKPLLLKALNDENDLVRKQADNLLKNFKDEDVVHVNLEKLRANDPKSRGSALDYLGTISADEEFAPIIHPAKAAILESLRDEDRHVKQRAISIVPRLLGKEAVPFLVECLDDSEPEVRRSALYALRELKDERALEPTLAKANDGNIHVKVAALSVLQEFNAPRVTDTCIKLLEDSSSIVQNAAVTCLGRQPSTKAAEPLISLLESPRSDFSVKSNIAEALARIGDPMAVDPLIALLATEPADQKTATLDRIKNMKKLTLIALGDIGDKRAYPALVAALDNNYLEESAIRALGKLKDPRAIPLLRKYLSEKNASLRNSAMGALGELGDPEALNQLIILSKEKNYTESRGSAAFLANTLRKFIENPDPELRERARATYNELEAQGILLPYEVNFASDGKKTAGVSQSELARVVTLTHEHGALSVSTMFQTSLEGSKGDEKRPRTVGIPILAGGGAQFSVMQGRQLQTCGNFALGQDPRVRAVINDPKRTGTAVITLDQDASNIDRSIEQLQQLPLQRKLQAVNSIAYLGDQSLIPKITPFVKDQNPLMRLAAVRALGLIRDKQAEPLLVNSLHDADTNVKVAAIWALGELNDARALENLPALLDDENERVRFAAIYALTKIDSPRAEEFLGKALSQHQDYRVRQTEAEVLGTMKYSALSAQLISRLTDQNPYVRQAAARALGRMGDTSAVQALAENLKDTDAESLFWTFGAIGQINDPCAIPSLVPLLIGQDKLTKSLAMQTLTAFHGAETRDVIGKNFLQYYERRDSRNLLIAVQLSYVLGEAGVVELMKDPDGDRSKTVKNLIRLLLTNSYDRRLETIGRNALKEYEDRELVISELSATVEQREEGYNHAVQFLNGLRDPKSILAFSHILKHKQAYKRYDRQLACNALGELEAKDSAPYVYDIFNDPHEEAYVKVSAIKALGKLGYQQAMPAFIDILKDKTLLKELRQSAAVALGQLRDPAAVSPLLEIACDGQNDVWFRVSAIVALGEIGDKSAVEPLKEIRKTQGKSRESGYLENALQSTLKKLNKADLPEN